VDGTPRGPPVKNCESPAFAGGLSLRLPINGDVTFRWIATPHCSRGSSVYPWHSGDNGSAPAAGGDACDGPFTFTLAVPVTTPPGAGRVSPKGGFHAQD